MSKIKKVERKCSSSFITQGHLRKLIGSKKRQYITFIATDYGQWLLKGMRQILGGSPSTCYHGKKKNPPDSEMVYV